MTRAEAEQLIIKYTDGTASREEEQLVEIFLHEFAQSNELLPSSSELEQDHKEIWNKLAKHIGINTEPRRLTFWSKLAATAAAVLLILGVGFYLNSKYWDKWKNGDSRYTSDVRPGHNKAILTLANGKSINLSDAKTGVVIDAQKLAYSDGTEIKDPALTGDLEHLNNKLTTVSTPRGGTYQVVLPDGSRVWINAESTLKFPSSFAKQMNREIELQGEAYFEVFKDAKHPFIVKTAQQEVEVLGTHFNINSYMDRNVTKTTLLEGSVAVHYGAFVGGRKERSSNIVLKPDQQSLLTNNSILLKEVQSADAVAWKNGYFMFDNEDLESIMQTLSRWYNTTIVYEDESLKKEIVFAKLSRYENISRILKLMERTDKVRFKVEGNRITISRN